ncbi:MAG TPA: tetratricopeptide repeat protein, partial [Candidatus Eisenbacteria bacterium]
DAEYSLAVQLADEGRDSEADSLYRSALRQRPDYEEAWLKLGDLDRRAGRLEEAEREFARAAALDPDDERAVVDLAVARAQRGDIAGALPLFRRALEMRPGDPLALGNLRSVVAVKEAERARAAGSLGRLPPPDDALIEAWQLLYDHTREPRWLEEIERGRAQRAAGHRGR